MEAGAKDRVPVVSSFLLLPPIIYIPFTAMVSSNKQQLTRKPARPKALPTFYQAQLKCKRLSASNHRPPCPPITNNAASQKNLAKCVTTNTIVQTHHILTLINCLTYGSVDCRQLYRSIVTSRLIGSTMVAHGGCPMSHAFSAARASSFIFLLPFISHLLSSEEMDDYTLIRNVPSRADFNLLSWIYHHLPV